MKPRAYRLRMAARSEWLERVRRFPQLVEAEQAAKVQKVHSDARIAAELGITKREVRRRRELAAARRRVARGQRITTESAIALGLQTSRAR